MKRRWELTLDDFLELSYGCAFNKHAFYSGKYFLLRSEKTEKVVENNSYFACRESDWRGLSSLNKVEPKLSFLLLGPVPIFFIW